MISILTNHSFLPPSVAEKYNLDIPDYKGVDQIVEPPAGQNAQSAKVYTFLQ